MVSLIFIIILWVNTIRWWCDLPDGGGHRNEHIHIGGPVAQCLVSLLVEVPSTDELLTNIFFLVIPRFILYTSTYDINDATRLCNYFVILKGYRAAFFLTMNVVEMIHKILF